MEIDLGDVVATFCLRVKGRREPQIRWKIGAAYDTTEADRIESRQMVAPHQGRVDLTMDLMADKKVTLTIEFTDEMGNPTATPEGASVTYTGDNPSVLNVTDNGDGTAVAAAMGPLGTANVHADVVVNGQTMSGDLAVNVVSGLAERVNIAAGEPEEVTPDDQA